MSISTYIPTNKGNVAMREDLDSLWVQCQTDTSERRAKFYGVFMLRSIAYEDTVVQALGTGKRQGRYKQRFGFLHTDYAAIFSDEYPQVLHPEIRTELRQRLLT